LHVLNGIKPRKFLSNLSLVKFSSMYYNYLILALLSVSGEQKLCDKRVAKFEIVVGI